MARITIKSLQEEIEQLKAVIEIKNNEVDKLTKEIKKFENEENLVTQNDYNKLLKDFENQKIMTDEYKKLYTKIKNKNDKDRDKYDNKINELQEQLSSAEMKLNDKNERGAGRKAFSDTKIIEMIYKLYLEKNSLQKVADELNSLEIKTKRNKDWNKTSIRFILLNAQNVINNYIQEDIFNSAVKLLNDNKKSK